MIIDIRVANDLIIGAISYDITIHSIVLLMLWLSLKYVVPYYLSHTTPILSTCVTK